MHCLYKDILVEEVFLLINQSIFKLNRNEYKKNSPDFCCFTIKIDSALELGCFKHTLVLFDVTAPSMPTFST